MKRMFILGLLLSFYISNTNAQRARIDSLSKIVLQLNDTGKMKVFFELGHDLLRISGDSSAMYAQRALDIALRLRNTHYEGECYALLGIREKNKGNFEKALNYHLKNLKLKEAEKDEFGMMVANNDIGIVYKNTKRYMQALPYYQQANAYSRKIGNTKYTALTYNNIGTIYVETNNLDSALFYYQVAYKYAKESGDTYAMSTSLTNLGEVYLDFGKKPEALAAFLQCLEYDKANEDKYGMGMSYFEIANVLGQMKQYARAMPYADTAARIMEAEHLNRERLDVLNIKATLEQNQGHYEQAIALLRQVYALKDTMLNTETNAHVAELQTKYETEKKENQIALQASEIDKRNYIIGGISSILLLGILLGTSSYRRYRLKQQDQLQKAIIKQQELATKAVIEAEERERKRIAGDLHDGLGQLMSAAKLNLSSVGNELIYQNEEQKQSFEKALALVDESCKEVRTVSHNIMPNALLKTGLASAIREFIDKIDSRVLKVNLYSEGLNERLPSNIETVLYRIVQECVNNVIKHSGANTLDISMIKDEDGVSITIEDNGKGFNATDKQKFEGIGLRNIQTRADYLKGTVEWDSAPGKGTVVMIHVPVEAA